MVYTITVHMKAKDDPQTIHKLKNKLIEASRVYSKDKETVSVISAYSVFWCLGMFFQTVVACSSPFH